MEVLVDAMGAIVLQYINVSNQQVHLRFAHCYMSMTSQSSLVGQGEQAELTKFHLPLW